MDERANPEATAAILEVVDNQLRQQEPPETKATYDRLLAEGYSNEEARRLIAVVLSSEIFTMMKNNEIFSRSRYVRMLHKLPQLPWD